MRYFLFFFISIIVSFLGFGQSMQVDFTWENPTVFTNDEGGAFYQLTFDGAAHYSSYDYLPTRLESIQGQKVIAASLSDLQTEILNPVEFQFVNKDSLTNDFQVHLTALQSGQTYSNRLFIIPLRVNGNGEIEKLISGKLNFQFGLVRTPQQATNFLQQLCRERSTR